MFLKPMRAPDGPVTPVRADFAGDAAEVEVRPRPALAQRAVVAVYAVVVLAIAAATILDISDAEARRVLLNAAFVGGSLVLVASVAVRLRRQGVRANHREAWLLAAGMGWLFGNGWWFYYQQVADSQPYPSWSDCGYLVALLCLAGVVGTFLPARKNAAALRRLVLDGLLISTGSAAFGWQLYADQAVKQASGQSAMALSVQLAYPVIDAALLSLVVLAMAHGLAGDASLRVLAAGLGFYVLADVGWNITAQHGGYTPGSAPFDAAWVAAYGLLALVPWTTSSDRRAEAPLDNTGFRWSIPPAALAVAAILLILLDYHGREAVDVAFVAGLIFLTLLRQLLLTHDFIVLSRTLEQEVADRTAELLGSHEEMRKLALHDSLTGLANRRQLMNALAEMSGLTESQVAAHTLVLIDVDDFKEVNDNLGHARGDDLLVSIAARLQSAARSGDMVARLGGDEFALLLRGVDEANACKTVRRVIGLLREPVILGQHRVSPRSSAGVANLQQGLSATELMIRADVAMYAAKGVGKDGYVVYDPAVHSAAAEAYLT